ncbi:Anaphase-promoting complex subunit 1 [Ptychographa xylographoides]|nr:Anaphase-promoting complex subunit 1 [Ptychographa xylographoides]
MADVKSLGIHEPTALPYLISEGILPQHAPETSYRWQIVSPDGGDSGLEEEELLTTKSCVIWSTGGVIRRIFRFEVEEESVVQAVLTNFSTRRKLGSSHSSRKAGLAASEEAQSPDSSHSVHGTLLNVISGHKSQSGSVSNGLLSEPSSHRSGISHTVRKRTDSERALVVILKTQAQVFFLSGTSHVVHLPFEVSTAFALPQGLILQRKLAEKALSQSTPALPSAPLNSFAFSNPGSSWPIPHSQPLQDLANSQERKDTMKPLNSMFKSILAQSTTKEDSHLPRHFCLTDPLSEMGYIAETVDSHVRQYRHRRRSPESCPLNSNEDVLYVSPTDELKHCHRGSSDQAPLLLALTRNRDTGLDTLWSVSFSRIIPGSRSAKRQSSVNGLQPRRRSSYGNGVATGTTTPGIRSSIGPGESVMGLHDTNMDRRLPQDDVELAAQLDPAFENPGNPARSSRRVSSLLARSDLATNRNNPHHPDLTGAHNATVGIKRGPSMGSQPARSSYGPDGIHLSDFRRSGTESHLGPASDKWLSTQAQVSHVDSESENGSSTGGRPQTQSGTRGRQVGMSFTKVHSFRSTGEGGDFSTINSGTRSRPSVFTLRQPQISSHGAGSCITMCIVDPFSRQLSILAISISRDLFDPKNPASTSEKDYILHRVRLTDIKRGNGVVSACKVFDRECSRILVLSETRDGAGELTLQAPWSTLKRIRLPSSLLIFNPYQISQDLAISPKREGGFKRVLSEGAGALTNVENAASNRVDVLDEKGMRHRIQIQMNPSSQLVRKLLRICEFVLPCETAELEPFTRVWWDVVSWLRLRPEEANDIEWTAFVVSIFSMFVGLIGARQTQNSLRQTKRTRGLLRSSSSTSADPNSWNTMMVREGNNCSSFPPWMQDSAWAWTQAITPVVPPYPSSQGGSPRQSRPTTIKDNVLLSTCTVARSTFLVDCFTHASSFSNSAAGLLALGDKGYLHTAPSKEPEIRRTALPTILIALHLFREELKLDVLSAGDVATLTPFLAQMGGWLDWASWSHKAASHYMLENDDLDHWVFDDSVIPSSKKLREVMEPPSIFRHIENAVVSDSSVSFTTLLDIVSRPALIDQTLDSEVASLQQLTPRTLIVLKMLSTQQKSSAARISAMVGSGLDNNILDTFPEGVAASLRASIASCQAAPVTTWPSSILELIDRDDIRDLDQPDQISRPRAKVANTFSHDALRDVHAICSSTLDTDLVKAYEGSAEADRQSITRMIFKEDQRFAEAMKLVHPLNASVARCIPEPDWSDTDLLEAQQELVKMIAVRTLSVASGRGMLFYSARHPLLTEKFPIHGYTLSCVMKPSNTTVTADRNSFSEDKVHWSFFHAGVEAGLSISKEAKGIDTSWILFNKPVELGNRHAGFLLALGLNGHLRSIAKWVAFKYLTPKHTMTSIGLLLGLAASYLGTMDTLVTRLLSVHVTRMLPQGAAELNLSPLTQTTGIMAIGLLYCNSQHRRMSEILLSEIENIDQDDTISPADNFRDEGYRLAAGFALGYINLGQGKNLKGLHDMRIVERLLALAVGTKRVDIVHILDKATAAAVVAVALIFMKTHDEALARKIDIPDTVPQFEYVRPDIFLLRTVARHLIMWDQIAPTTLWMREQLPLAYQYQVKMTGIRTLSTQDMPLLNIVAGLCLSIGLRYAGTARQDARNLLGHYLDQFIRICRLPALNYDGKLTRITARNCQDAVALAVASIMAGTGDLYVFRRLRALHGRADPDTPYGSHLATHMAIGVLFLAGGTHSLSTSNIAIASLLCAFYPLFPTSFLDNKNHLQAFRHFWVLAAEPRCLNIRDVDTYRSLSVSIVIVLRTGAELSAVAPCLLPELESISKIYTSDPSYWSITLDFMQNPTHLPAFKRHQSMYVRRRGAYDAQSTVFSATLQALNDAQSARQANAQAFEWLFDLPSFRAFGRAERSLVLPSEGAMVLQNRTRSTVVDDRLVLERMCLDSGRAEGLWNLRVLFAWADGVRKQGKELGWLGKEVIERLRATVWLMGQEMEQDLE